MSETNGIKLKSRVWKYENALVLKQTYCVSCERLIMPKGVMLSFTRDDIIQRAEAAHAKGVESGEIPCFNPQLVITYETALVSKQAIKTGAILTG